MSEPKDKIPWEFLDTKSGNTRSGAMEFMWHFRRMVRNGKRVDDYLVYAAELLGAAADAAEEPDTKKRPTAIMKAMDLDGKMGNGRRDYEITCAMLCLTKLMNMSQQDAKTELSFQLEEQGVEAPEESLISIYKRYLSEQVEGSFYSRATSLANLDEDLGDHFCNYELLSRHFPPL